MLSNLILRLLNPSQPHFYGWLKRSAMDYSIDQPFPIWRCGSGVKSSLILAYACYFNVIEAAEMFIAQNPNCDLSHPVELVGLNDDYQEGVVVSSYYAQGTPLQIGLILQRKLFAQLFLQHGASVPMNSEVASSRTLSALQMGCSRDCCNLNRVSVRHYTPPT